VRHQVFDDGQGMGNLRRRARSWHQFNEALLRLAGPMVRFKHYHAESEHFRNLDHGPQIEDITDLASYDPSAFSLHSPVGRDPELPRAVIHLTGAISQERIAVDHADDNCHFFVSSKRAGNTGNVGGGLPIQVLKIGPMRRYFCLGRHPESLSKSRAQPSLELPVRLPCYAGMDFSILSGSFTAGNSPATPGTIQSCAPRHSEVCLNKSLKISANFPC
jgi:hypothetical protein